MQFTENVVVGVTGIASSITVAVSNISSALKDITCCRANGIKVNALLTITSVAAA